MEFFELVKKRRSVRSFRPEPVAMEDLTRLVEAARVAPSAANLQPLEYVVVTEPGLCEQIFACLKWAAHTAPRGTPAPGHLPTAYIAVLVREEYQAGIGADYDVGAAAQSILLGAVALGLGACWLKSINYPKVSELLGLPQGVKLDSIIALGYPDEEPRQVDLKPEDQGTEVTHYWRDDNDQHFVPKRALEAILHRQRYGQK